MSTRTKHEWYKTFRTGDDKYLCRHCGLRVGTLLATGTADKVTPCVFESAQPCKHETKTEPGPKLTALAAVLAAAMRVDNLGPNDVPLHPAFYDALSDLRKAINQARDAGLLEKIINE